MSFFVGCWKLSPLEWVWLVMEELESVQDVRWGFLFALWLPLSVGVGVYFQAAGVEVLMVGP